jgi:GTP-binding protein LepA
MDQARIRNFCIIAHIDHGKSTLADRLLELTGTVEKRQMKAQLLDQMELERERGITIKLAPVRMNYKSYELNLIDTPGHVDFSYEVSRSLAAVEGAILVVDASRGIQAQTLANVYLALAADLKIIPVLNKIDLPAADVERVSAEVIALLGCKKEDILLVSAKTGKGVEEVLEKIITDIPPPNLGGMYKKVHSSELSHLDATQGSSEERASRTSGTVSERQSVTDAAMRQEPAGAVSSAGGLGKAVQSSETRALIFDSYYDDYRGVILYVRTVDGEIAKESRIKMLATNAEGLALEVGSLKPDMTPSSRLNAGEIGYIVTNLKSARQARVGDTVTLTKSPATQALPGYKKVNPFVYAGFFPQSHEDFQALKEAIEKLALSDSALRYQPESSPVLGFGVRIGFLGLLHMDIVRERLKREYDLQLIITNPSTDFKVLLTSGHELDIKSAAELPDMSQIAEIREPWVKGEIVAPNRYAGAVLSLIVNARGRQKHIGYVDADLAVIDFEAPLTNLLTDFYDRLKSLTSGYGSFNYELAGYAAGDLVRLDFYITGDRVDALSAIVHRSEAERLGRAAVEKLKEIIPRQNFKVSLQAAVGGKFIAREDISAYRKDVTSGLYGGDVTRKKKVLAKQKRGKERLKRFGQVDIPAEAFTVMLRKD